MSNPIEWLKKHGAKIVIKFTQSITSNLDGNEDAISISALEPKYIKFPSLELGPLIDSDIQVDKVDYYPVSTEYEEDFEGGTIDDVVVTGAGLQLGVI